MLFIKILRRIKGRRRWWRQGLCSYNMRWWCCCLVVHERCAIRCQIITTNVQRTCNEIRKTYCSEFVNGAKQVAEVKPVEQSVETEEEPLHEEKEEKVVKVETRLQEGWMRWVIEFVDISWFAETQAKAINMMD